MMKPSVMAVISAKKRARAQGKTTSPDAKRAPINMMDVLKAFDSLARRVQILESESKKNRNY